jgi:DNA-directed RNA polymerase subunit beta'
MMAEWQWCRPRIVDTTAGRYMLGQELPKNPSLPFDTINKLMTKKEISRVIDASIVTAVRKKRLSFCDHIMKVGFREACNAGISFGKDDMVIPEDKIADLSKKPQRWRKNMSSNILMV